MLIIHRISFCCETLCFMSLEKSPRLLSGLYVEFLKTYPTLSSQSHKWGGGFVFMLLQRTDPIDECHEPRVQMAFLIVFVMAFHSDPCQPIFTRCAKSCVFQEVRDCMDKQDSPSS